MKRLYLGAVIFATVIILIGIGNFIVNGEDVISQIQEKNLTLEEIASGEAARTIEESYVGNFIFKDRLMDFSKNLTILKGKSDKAEIIDTTGINVAQDWKNDAEQGEMNQTDYGSILIIDNKAMELNRYDAKAIDSYASTLNKVAENLKDSIPVYSLLIPTQIEFIENQHYKAISYSQREAIQETYSKYQDVIGVSVYETLQEHSQEYIYFRTDHHWTQLGAYYAYAEFIRQLDLEPVELKEFHHFEIPDFLGSLYRMTDSEKLEKNKDVIDVYQPKTPSLMYWSTSKDNLGASIIDENYATEDNKYGVFIHGDNPMIYIETQVNNDSSIVIIKDSYANAFVPFLTNHFKRIYVIDPRIWEGNLYELIENENIEAVMFLNYALINRYEGYSDVLQEAFE